MKYIVGILFATLLCAAPVLAQIYDGKDTSITSSFDTVADAHRETYINYAFPGDVEDAIPQDVRYNIMVNAMDGANENHFMMGVNAQIDRESRP